MAQRARHRAIEHLMHQRGFARAGDAGDGHQHSERNFDVETVDVVGRGAAQDEALLARRAAARGHGNGELAGEIAAGERIGVGLDLGQHALGEQLAAQLARAGAEVEQMVGGAQNVGVVLDDEDGVAQVAQLFKNVDQPGRVAGVQADGRLVEHIERAHQPRAERGGQLNALRLAAGERGGKAVEGEVFQADRVEKSEPLANLFEDRAGDLLLHGREPQRAEELLGLGDGERGGLADIQAVDADAARLGPQALAAAVGTLGIAAIFAEHDAHMQLVLLALHLRKEAVDAGESCPCRAAPSRARLRAGRARARRAERPVPRPVCAAR